jgi:hypothetical protein
MGNFENVLVPAFGWLVLGVIGVAMLMWVWRVGYFLIDDPRAGFTEETMGLPKGAVRTFVVISFSGIMFLIFFGDFPGIPADDRKWFLTAYSSVLAFYFGSRYFQARAERERRGLAITSISPPIGKRPTNGAPPSDIVIEGSGFESPRAVTFTQGATSIPTANLEVNSVDSVKVAVKLAATTPSGAYDVAVELANGSKVVYKSGFTVEE